MRIPIVAANWKMHKTSQEAADYCRRLRELVPKDPGVELVIFPPFTALGAVRDELAGTRIKWGAQNVHPEPEGAFTGEVSLPMLLEYGISYVIVGHSERRRLFGETDDFIAAKLQAALDAGVRPILCVGETLEERRAGRAKEVVERQLSLALGGISPDKAREVVIAYEPVWAIGTGVPAHPEDAQAMAAHIRGWLRERYGDVAQEIRIQYGGSVKPDNAGDFLRLPDIDGALVGGASLDPVSFWGIASSAL
ncbi:MAG TPA: triose-phosphate isomerase [Candidatus Acetothermia bacterium]|nr:triose-phosphate isomerase [Candidatus Acetothermia bacterium]